MGRKQGSGNGLGFGHVSAGGCMMEASMIYEGLERVHSSATVQTMKGSGLLIRKNLARDLPI